MNIFEALCNPRAAAIALIGKINTSFIGDETYLKIYYRLVMKRKLNLKDPRTYNEKLQWLKLYDRNPLYTKLVDKYEAKKIVGDIIGSEYIIPTIGIYEHFDEIDFDKFPSKFVLKCTHDSGGIVVCKDKTKFDYNEAKRIIEKGLRKNYYHQNREWPYRNVHPRIIAESYMEDSDTAELRDYKFFCFDGKVKALFIASDRMNKNEETKFDFFDENFNHLPFTNGHPNAKVLPEKPKSFELMIELASRLSKGIPHVRVDLYEVDGKVFFGEMTFYHWSGTVPFNPEKWDLKFGEWINLPKK